MSDAQDDSQKTEEPTARKLSEARKKGQIAQSKEVSNFAALLGMAFMVAAIAPFMALYLFGALAGVVEHAASVRVDPGSTGRILFDLTLDSMIALSPALGLFMVLGLAAGLGQSGFLLTTQPIVPKLEKISPLAGFKRQIGRASCRESVCQEV